MSGQGERGERVDLGKIRQEIDRVDAEVVRLLNERARLALEVGRQKEEADAAVYVPARERDVLQRVAAHNAGPLPPHALRSIYREIISACRSLEKPLQIAYWGPPASNTHVASLVRFGGGASYSPYPSIADVFCAVERREADYGVVPVENSTEGIVNHTLDMFLESRLRICWEVYVRIAHNLLSHCRALEEVRTLFSMPQATGQCRQWLSRYLPHAEIVDVTTTAKAAESAGTTPASAAIANRAASDHYGVPILQEHIEDNPRNRTRFLVIGHNEPAPTGKDKTSIMFAVKNEAGALYRALAACEKYDVNLTMIESRPTKLTPWEYVFFIDVTGHINGQGSEIPKALALMQKECLFTRVLGSYPEAEEE
jgi:chorismate mutase / prephenate dehydratase